DAAGSAYDHRSPCGSHGPPVTSVRSCPTALARRASGAAPSGSGRGAQPGGTQQRRRAERHVLVDGQLDPASLAVATERQPCIEGEGGTTPQESARQLVRSRPGGGARDGQVLAVDPGTVQHPVPDAAAHHLVLVAVLEGP